MLAVSKSWRMSRKLVLLWLQQGVRAPFCLPLMSSRWVSMMPFWSFRSEPLEVKLHLTGFCAWREMHFTFVVIRSRFMRTFLPEVSRLRGMHRNSHFHIITAQTISIFFNYCVASCEILCTPQSTTSSQVIQDCAGILDLHHIPISKPAVSQSERHFGIRPVMMMIVLCRLVWTGSKTWWSQQRKTWRNMNALPRYQHALTLQSIPISPWAKLSKWKNELPRYQHALTVHDDADDASAPVPSHAHSLRQATRKRHDLSHRFDAKTQARTRTRTGQNTCADACLQGVGKLFEVILDSLCMACHSSSVVLSPSLPRISSLQWSTSRVIERTQRRFSYDFMMMPWIHMMSISQKFQMMSNTHLCQRCPFLIYFRWCLIFIWVFKCNCLIWHFFHRCMYGIVWCFRLLAWTPLRWWIDDGANVRKSHSQFPSIDEVFLWFSWHPKTLKCQMRILDVRLIWSHLRMMYETL